MEPGTCRRLVWSAAQSRFAAPILPGMRLSDIAAIRQQDPLDVALDILLAEEGNAGVVLFMMDDAQVQDDFTPSPVMIGSDAGATAPYGVLGRSATSACLWNVPVFWARMCANAA